MSEVSHLVFRQRLDRIPPPFGAGSATSCARFAYSTEKRWPQAAKALERAIDLLERSGADPVNLPVLRFQLAELRWSHGQGSGARGQALTLATQARDGFRSLGPPGASELAEIERWLASHPRR